MIVKLPKRHNGHIISGVLHTYTDFIKQMECGKVRVILVKHNGKPKELIRFLMAPGSPIIPKFVVN